MIVLSNSTPFAEGGNRKCYVHPNNPDRCLKVVHPGLLEKIIIKIIDGLGPQAFIPLHDYSTYFAKRYVEKRIKLMWSRINWDLSGRKGNWK